MYKLIYIHGLTNNWFSVGYIERERDRQADTQSDRQSGRDCLEILLLPRHSHYNGIDIGN